MAVRLPGHRRHASSAGRIRSPRWSCRSASRSTSSLTVGRRRPLVLRAGLPVQARRDPRAIRTSSTSPSTQPGTYGGPVRRVLRRLPRPDAADGPGRHAAGVRRVARGAVGRRVGTRRDPPDPVASRRPRRPDRPRREPPPGATSPAPRRPPSPAAVPEVGGLTGWLTTTDHKRIGDPLHDVGLRVLPRRRAAGRGDADRARRAGPPAGRPSRATTSSSRCTAR